MWKLERISARARGRGRALLSMVDHKGLSGCISEKVRDCNGETIGTRSGILVQRPHPRSQHSIELKRSLEKKEVKLVALPVISLSENKKKFYYNHIGTSFTEHNTHCHRRLCRVAVGKELQQVASTVCNEPGKLVILHSKCFHCILIALYADVCRERDPFAPRKLDSKQFFYKGFLFHFFNVFLISFFTFLNYLTPFRSCSDSETLSKNLDRLWFPFLDLSERIAWKSIIISIKTEKFLKSFALSLHWCNPRELTQLLLLH